MFGDLSEYLSFFIDLWRFENFLLYFVERDIGVDNLVIFFISWESLFRFYNGYGGSYNEKLCCFFYYLPNEIGKYYWESVKNYEISLQ